MVFSFSCFETSIAKSINEAFIKQTTLLVVVYVHRKSITIVDRCLVLADLKHLFQILLMKLLL